MAKELELPEEKVKTLYCTGCKKDFPTHMMVDYIGAIVCPFCLLKIYRQACGADYTFDDPDLIKRLALAHQWLEYRAKVGKVIKRVGKNLEKLQKCS